MSEMDAIINNYDEKHYKEESSTAYETSSPQQTEYTSDSFLLFHEKKLKFTSRQHFSFFHKHKELWALSLNGPLICIQIQKRIVSKESETSPPEYLKPSTEATYHKESEPSTPEFYPKPSSVTSGPTYYGQNDDNSVRIFPHFYKIFYLRSWQ